MKVAQPQRIDGSLRAYYSMVTTSVESAAEADVGVGVLVVVLAELQSHR